MFSKPQAEHEWLQPLVGEFTSESDCMDQDGNRNVFTGTLSGCSVGGMWVVLKGEGVFGDEPWENRIVLGYDATQGRYVGTFIGSMFTQMWLYNGQIDPTDGRLVLDTVGPKFTGEGTANYQDIVEIVDKDRILDALLQQGELRGTGFAAQALGHPSEQQAADFEQILDLAGRERSHPRAAIGLHGDDAVFLQDAKRLPHRRAADLQAARDLDLRNAFARLVSAERDGFAELLGDLVGQGQQAADWGAKGPVLIELWRRIAQAFGILGHWLAMRVPRVPTASASIRNPKVPAIAKQRLFPCADRMSTD